MLEESTELLKPTSGKVYLDGTFGGGGHSLRLLELSGPNGRVVGLDRDPNVEPLAQPIKTNYQGRFEFHCLSYEDIGSLGLHFDGAILDLGLSSDQLESSTGLIGRGFSFQRNEPLDLRFDDRHGQTAAQFLMQSSASQIEHVFKYYGEDRYAKKLAVRIVSERRSRPIRTTKDFTSYVGTDNPKVLAPLFQALRIEVNDELGVLERGLKAITSVLVSQAIMAVISFHSLEDRIVKNHLRSEAFESFAKKPILPSEQEIKQNPRSRSAKLRWGQVR